MRGLDFETATPALAPHPQRVDVACFAGFVGRRGGALPAAVRGQLERTRFLAGPWARPGGEVDALLGLPVVVESWAAFESLFAWEARPVDEAGERRAATHLGAAVRSFFAQGGRRAVVIRVGDPWPVLEDTAARDAARAARLDALLDPQASPADPTTWHGIGHLHDLPEVALLCLPDLPDVCAGAPGPVPVALEPPSSPEVFVECSEGPLEGVREDLGLRDVAPPRLDESGMQAWAAAVGRARERIARHHREVVLFAALPLVQAELQRDGAWARRDYLAWMEAADLLAPPSGASPRAVGSAFVQLAWPWLRTRHGDDLPSGLEPPDGLLCGAVARNALSRGTFRSVAGSRVGLVHDTEPRLSLSGGEETPDERLARRACVVGPSPDGFVLHSDVSASGDEAWRAGGVTRLMGAVLRNARAAGESALFEASGPQLWQRVRRAIERTLLAFWREGGLGGATAAEAFDVRCDRSTMDQNDLDNGRLVAEITVLPVASVERITVVLDLVGGGAAAGGVAEVA